MISAVAKTMLIPTVSPMKTDANITLDIVQRYEKTLAELSSVQDLQEEVLLNQPFMIYWG